MSDLPVLLPLLRWSGICGHPLVLCLRWLSAGSVELGWIDHRATS